MKAFVYILKNEEGKYYIGSTVDLEKRVRDHVSGFTPSTKRMGKLTLVFSQEYTMLLEARRIEYKLKRLKRRDYIEQIVLNGIIKMK